MKKDILISVTGIQFDIDKEEKIKTISSGEYYYKNGKHYIFYEETLEGNGENISTNRLKISNNCVELTKKGGQDMTMVFEPQKKTASCYQTPFGALLLEIFTKQIDIQIEPSQIMVSIDYFLDMNGNRLSDCSIVISVKESV